jgi:hypothetical protein
MLSRMKSIYESEQNFLKLDKFYSSQNLFQFSLAGAAFSLGRGRGGTLVEIETKTASCWVRT